MTSFTHQTRGHRLGSWAHSLAKLVNHAWAKRVINRVEIGPIKIELNAERKVLDGNRIRVKFKETAFYVFGNEVKRSEVKGAGVWDYLFSGSVVVNGENMFLRVLKTPSTFIIAQTE